MVERVLTVISNDGKEKKKQMIKTYSFTTDDDETTSVVKSLPKTYNQSNLKNNRIDLSKFRIFLKINFIPHSQVVVWILFS